MNIYRIIIQGTKDGKLGGISAAEFDANGNPGLPRPVKPEDFPSFAADINTASLATITDLQAQLDAVTKELAAYKANDPDLVKCQQLEAAQAAKAAAEATIAKLTQETNPA